MTFLAIVVLYLVADFVGLWALWSLFLRGPRQPYPTCGQCGYIVEGVEKMACPECGGDFRRVGIVTPRQQLRIKPVVFAMLWLMLLAPLALLGAIMCMLVVWAVEGRDELRPQAVLVLGLLTVAVYGAGILVYLVIRRRRQNALSRTPQPPPGDRGAVG